jgi:hypothetical protein
MTAALAVFASLLALRLAGQLATLALVGRTPALFAWHRRLRRTTGDPTTDAHAPVYMDRWQLFRSPWLDIYVNRINLPDSDEHPHTHPWRASWSLKLRGSYVERVWYRAGWMPTYPDGIALRSIKRTPPRWSRIPWCHQIVALGERLHVDISGAAVGELRASYEPAPAWTLFIGVGRRAVGTWGFIDPRTGELVRKGGSDVQAKAAP